MKNKLICFLFIAFSFKGIAQVQTWSPYLVLTQTFTQPDGFVKMKITVKKDSLIYQIFEPGKEMDRRMALDSTSQQHILKLIDEHKLLSLNTKADKNTTAGTSVTYVMDKFMKVIHEPKNSKNNLKFQEYIKEFLEIVLPIVFKEEMKSSWH